MPTPSTDGASSPDRKVARDLRDSWIFRLVALVVVLLVAFGVARSCGSAGRNVTADEAVVIARESTDFEPGQAPGAVLPARTPAATAMGGLASTTSDPRGRPIRVHLVIVDATTGAVVEQAR